LPSFQAYQRKDPVLRIDNGSFGIDLGGFKTVSKVVEIVDGQKQLFQARREALSGEIGVLKRQVSQYRDQISAFKAQMEADAKQLELVNSQIADVKKLLKKGFARKTHLTDLQRTAARIEGDRLENRAHIAGVEQRISEIELKIINTRTAYLNEAVDALQTVQKEISDHEKRLQAAREVLLETEMKVGQAFVAGQAWGTFKGRRCHSSWLRPTQVDD